MTWDWQIFCKSTMDGTAIVGCLGKDGDVTYLDWMLSAWGWTLPAAVPQGSGTWLGTTPRWRTTS